jgi:hypothetical protein
LEVDEKFSVLARKKIEKASKFLPDLTSQNSQPQKNPFYLLAKIDFHFSSVDFEISFVRGLRKFFVKN